MKKLLIFGFFVLFLSGCEEKTEYSLYLVRVDSVAVPNFIVSNNSFEIGFYGLGGRNSCSEFSHFEASKSGNQILIECWGKDYSVSYPCHDTYTSLVDQKLNYLIKETGNYLIQIKQPDNSYLEKEIKIE